MLSGIIVTHARLAAALREAVTGIAGEVDHLETISNNGLGPEQIAARVREALDRAAGQDCIVFVDLSGGSCATSSLQALRDRPGVRIVTGVNLPMLVDFVLRRDDLDLDAMVQRLLQRGHASIQELKGP
jgi:mannose/fructose-specific phosphotransferase system component IIA